MAESGNTDTEIVGWSSDRNATMSADLVYRTASIISCGQLCCSSLQSKLLQRKAARFTEITQDRGNNDLQGRWGEHTQTVVFEIDLKGLGRLITTRELQRISNKQPEAIQDRFYSRLMAPLENTRMSALWMRRN
ncbi:hypothetical protein N7G274_000857 [Stereocaulon virgatum]|uniref:Uncharacterized protein n=1 Tax=Stereocaulon virgatum TaxID=373712 RepID=A0ABR4AMV1_9LECA